MGLSSREQSLIQWVFAALFLASLGGMLWLLLFSTAPNRVEWFIGATTSAYVWATLLIFVATSRSARAAERAADAMQASAEEAMKLRWAQVGAYVRPSPGTFRQLHAERWQIVLENVFHLEPAFDLHVRMWPMTSAGPHDSCAMMESEFPSAPNYRRRFRVTLVPSQRPEPERRGARDEALRNFREQDRTDPQHVLCWIRYSHRANMKGSVFAHDLEPPPVLGA
jgi:pimeloyl-ACP methyl ester carboxylesterase